MKKVEDDMNNDGPLNNDGLDVEDGNATEPADVQTCPFPPPLDDDDATCETHSSPGRERDWPKPPVWPTNKSGKASLRTHPHR